MENFLKSSFANELLYVLAASNFVSRQTVLAMNKDNYTSEYIKKYIRGMINDGLLSASVYDKKHEYALKLRKHGIATIRQKDDKIAVYYLNATNGNRLSTDKTHMDPSMNAGDIHYMMLRAKIKFGTQKPSIMEILKDGAEQNQAEDKTFYLLRDLKTSTAQKKTSATISRGTGLLVTPALTGIVYRVRDPNMKFVNKTERIVNIRMKSAIKTLYQVDYADIPQKAIVIGNDMTTAYDLMQAPPANIPKQQTLWHGIYHHPDALAAEVVFLPLTIEGARQLELLTTYNHEDIVGKVFSEREAKAAIGRPCDAYLENANLECYEFITANLTRLAQIKRLYIDEGGKRETRKEHLGFACLEYQKPFLRQYFAGLPLRFRQFHVDQFTTQGG